MKKTLLTVATMALTLTSCSTLSTAPIVTQTQSKSLEYMESSARVLEAEHHMLAIPVIAELDVSDKKINYTEKDMFANLDVTHALLNNIVELKKIALSRAARAYDADVLLGATIDVVTKNGRLEITVSGYPAHYVKFRKAKNEDVELIKNVYNVKTVNGADVINTQATKLNIQKTEKVFE